MSKSIPDRWLEYKPFGKVISGTKILPFKVPLKETLNNNLEADKRFTPSMLLQEFPQLKCIIDLTNTQRYYSEKEFTDSGVKYVKLAVPGRELPSQDVLEIFFGTLDDFKSTCGEEDIIGVHCTHGINRTGYLICRYLVQQLGWELEDTLKAFEEARGYPIERPIYLNKLKLLTRGEKLDMSEKEVPRTPFKTSGVKRPRMGPPRRGFAQDGPFPPQPFGFGGPPPYLGPMTRMPPPGMPPIPPPPPPGPSHRFGPRPFRYGPPPQSAFPPPPPRPGFFTPDQGFPARVLGPPRPPSATRLPPGPPIRLPPPKMPPPPVSARPVPLKSLQMRKKKQHSGNNINELSRRPIGLIRRNRQMRVLPKLFKEQDFTIDTFEENLLAVSGQQHRRLTRGRYNQTK